MEAIADSGEHADRSTDGDNGSLLVGVVHSRAGHTDRVLCPHHEVNCDRLKLQDSGSVLPIGHPV